MSQAPHYFKFHIGDYLRDAAELSLMQHGAYLRLMLWYYATAKPLPNDTERIYRRVGALSNEERYAVDYILSEFFVLDGLTWRHKRIDLELRSWEQFILSSSEGGKRAKEKRLQNNKATSTDLHTDLPSDGGSNQNQNQNQKKQGSTSKSSGSSEVTKSLSNVGGHFRVPALDEVREYIAIHGYKVDPQKFVDHYTANGWKVGRNPMRDWKAAVRTWVRLDDKPLSRTEQMIKAIK